MDNRPCPALGRIAKIGTLYDAKTDKFLDASILSGHLSTSYVSTQPHRLTEISTSRCASYEDVFKDFHLEEDTAINILSRIIEPKGASSFLREFVTGSRTIHAAVIHQVSTVQQTLNNVSEAFKFSSDLMFLRANDCTHVVTGIIWGLQTVIAAGCPASGRSGLFEDEEAALTKDLEVLRSAIGSANQTPQEPSRMELCHELTLFSDVLESDGLIMQDLAEVCNFIRIVPDHIRQENGGKGRPIAYTMIPVTTLSYILSLPQAFQYNLKPIRPDYLTNFIRLFDELEASAAKLYKYYTYLTEHGTHVAKDHMNEVFDLIKFIEETRDVTTKELFYALLDVRQGIAEPSVLYDVYRSISQETTPKQHSAIAGQEVDKLEFIANAIAEGAIYLGHNGIPLDAIKKSHGNTSFCVFHFNSASMDQGKDWNDNCALLLELLGQKDECIPVYIMDHDAIDSQVNPEPLPRISQYEGEIGHIVDVLASRQFEDSKCFARSDAVLDRSKHERPVKRRLVKIHCPNPGCDSKHVEWICPHCCTEIEYGYSDEFFYCECGRGLFSTYGFRCNDPNHGPSFEKYDAKELRKLLGGLGQSDYINILILGETGVGKSTFINAFVNYLSYSTLDEAKDATELSSAIPCSFSLQTMDREHPETGIQEYNVKVGARDDEVDGSTGKSATQKSSVYSVIIGTKTYRLIDTPGIGDTRGLSYDKENMADILKTISAYDDLHGILVLVKSNNARLTLTFRFCVKELLTHLHRSATKNMAFGFTNTRISNYAPGDTFKPLKSLLDENSDIPITLTTSTTYCFDSESFRYLAAYKQGIKMPNEEDYRRSWDQSSREASRLLEYFSSTTPHPISSTLSLNGARKLILELTKPMAGISDIIRRNIKLCEGKRHELKSTKLTASNLRRKLLLERIQFEAKKLEKPRTVCKNTDCCDFKDSGLDDGVVVTIYKTHCHAECYLNNVKEDVVADPGLIDCSAFDVTNTCITCFHRWQEHLHVLYDLTEVKVEVKDTEIERQLKANADEMTLRQTGLTRLDQDIKEYNEELDEIRRAAARFCLFLRANAITVINDATLDYLDMLIIEEKGAIEAGRQRGIDMDRNEERLQALQDDRKIHLELVETFKQNMVDPTCPDDMLLDEQGVDALVKKLYDLKHFGTNLEHVKYVITSSLEETHRERPIRVQTTAHRKYASNVRMPDDGYGRPRFRWPQSHSSATSTYRGHKGYNGAQEKIPGAYPPHSYADAARVTHHHPPGSRSGFGRFKFWR